MLTPGSRTDASFSGIPKTAKYYSAWRDYRNRELWLLAGVAASPVEIATVILLLSSLLGEQLSFGLGFGLAIAILLVVGNRFAFWRCPRCKKPFHADFGRMVNPMSRSCVHCALPKWSLDGGESME